MPALRFSTAAREHAEEIKKFMFDEFRVNEPITASLSATQTDLADFFSDLSKSGYSHEKYSTLVHQDDRLVGVCLCSVHNYNNDVEADSSYPDPEQYDFAEDIAQGPYTQHKANQLVTFVATLERRQRELLHHANKVMKIDVICVSREARGRGLGKDLVRTSIEMAIVGDCDWVATAATAAASQALFSRMGFQSLFEIPYASFRENGRAVFQNLHDGCTSGKFMALRLKQG